MSRPIRARISAAALAHNLGVARRHAGSARVWAVIKANAYGHGLERAAQALSAADGYAVLDMADAIRLRATHPGHRVLLLEGIFSAAEAALLAAHGITAVVHEAGQIAMLRGVPAAPGSISVCLKLNTGMNRLGFPVERAAAAYQALRAEPSVGEIGLMTHFADADGAGVAGQLERYRFAVQDLQGPRSLANSAALLRYPETCGDWVRPGIMLYGGSPFAERSAESLGLRPAMQLTSTLIAVQSLTKGDRVGYGNTFEAARKMRIGIVACGYADGYPRHAPNGTPVLVAGRRTGTVGRVSMDMICVDLSTVPEADVGTPVTLWGNGLPADEVAAAAGTVSYELFCALAQRVPVSEIAGFHSDDGRV
jgi:alanine racemase